MPQAVILFGGPTFSRAGVPQAVILSGIPPRSNSDLGLASKSLRESTRRAKRAGKFTIWPCRKGGFLKEIDPACEARRRKFAISACRKGGIFKEIDPAREARQRKFTISALP